MAVMCVVEHFYMFVATLWGQFQKYDAEYCHVDFLTLLSHIKERGCYDVDKDYGVLELMSGVS